MSEDYAFYYAKMISYMLTLQVSRESHYVEEYG